MPYKNLSEASPAIKGIEPGVTLAQANVIADWADVMEKADDGPDNPWAAAIAQFKRLYEKGDDGWTKRPTAQAGFTCECLECKHVETLPEGEHCADTPCPKCGGQMRRQERPGPGQMSALQFVCNTVEVTVRHEMIDGTEYLIAPVVAIRQGVLKGEFVSAEEIERSTQTWNGRPFVIGHPKDVEGRDITANDPERLASIQAGRLFNCRFDDDAIKAELWVDVGKARLIDGGPETLQRLEAGGPLEVSTAYWRDSEPTIGSFNGKTYATAAHNLRPDHIAGLLDKPGACSWADGCGAPRVNEGGEQEDGMNEMQANVLGKARRPTYDGTTNAPWTTPSLDDYLKAYPDDKPDTSQVGDLPQAVKSWIAGHTLLGDPKADDFHNLSFFPVVTPDGKLSGGALRAVLGGRAAQAKIPEAAKKSAQAVARGLLEDKFDMEAQEQEQEQPGGVLNILQGIAKALGIETQEDRIMANKAKMIKTITDDGRLELNDDALADLSDDVLAALVKALGGWKIPEEKPEEEPEKKPKGNEETTEEPEEESAEEPARANEEEPCEPCANEALDKLAALEAEVKSLRDGMKALRDNVEAPNNKRKAELVTKLAANADCAFGKDRLKAMALGDLELLHQSLSPADYGGQGGGPVSNEVKLEPYAMPDVLSKKEDE